MEKIAGLALTFDDVLLIPLYSDVLPIQVDTETMLTRHIKLRIPLVSAPMDTVTEAELAIEMARSGGVGVIHRNMLKQEEASQIKRVKEAKITESSSLGKDGHLLVGGAVGVSKGEMDRVKHLIDANCDFIVVDTSHGHSKRVGDFVAAVKKKFPHIDIIAGNVATEEGARFLIDAGVDGVKVGVGPGSICTTRIVSGAGVPQATAILNVSKICKKNDIPLIADGGIRTSGDITKAIGLGADSVMIGSLFAGCKESPGRIIERDGAKYKYYRGMGSVPAMRRGSSDRYGEEGNAKMVSEGVEALTLYRGKVKDVVFQLIGGLRSGMGYVGAHNIEELQEKALFYKITTMGLIESRVHNVKEF